MVSIRLKCSILKTFQNSSHCTKISPHEHCYCPAVGPCEIYGYYVSLESLILNNTHIGDHNREYHFTVEATNQARLIYVNHQKILVDHSPPAVGVVFDAPPGFNDSDYTQFTEVTWHWKSFMDHESGILVYHYVVDDRCLNKEELLNITFSTGNQTHSSLYFGESAKNYVTITLKNPGKYHMTIVAFNGAMEPSSSVCSDGIVVDLTPSKLIDIRIDQATTQMSLACDFNKTIWFVDEKIMRREVQQIDNCRRHCFSSRTDVTLLPKHIYTNGSYSAAFSVEESIKLCDNYPTYTVDQPIFLPSDTIKIQWSFIEPESQMFDYMIGLASNRENVIEPDLKYFHNTKNHTYYQCFHCGLGEGVTLFAVLKGINTAGFETHVILGPLIIDETSPIYQGGMEVHLTMGLVTLQWPYTAFYDNEDKGTITDYEWTLGKLENNMCKGNLFYFY